ncbi:MAG: FtsX-like permease family protein [Thermocladium sp.]|jgi:putative ABC transport system permease protein
MNYGLLVKLAIKNMRSKRSRTILTTLTIIYAVALMVALETVTHGVQLSVTNEVKSILPADVIIYSSTIAMPQQVASAMTHMNYVSSAVPAILIGNAVVNGESITLIGMPTSSLQYFYPNLISGGLMEEPGDCIISSQLAEKLGVGVGDYIYVMVPEGLGGLGSTYQVIKLRVAGIFSSIFGGLFGFQVNIVVTSLSYLQTQLGVNGFVNTIFVKLTRDSSTTLTTFVNAIHVAYPDAQVYEQQNIIGAIGNVISLVNTFFVLIIVLSLAIAGLSIANTMLMNINERLREIGILKAIGSSNSQIMIMFMAESIIMTIIGSIIGVVVGFYGAHGVSALLNALGYSINIEIVPLPSLFALGFAASIIISIIASIVPIRRVAKVRPMEVLRTG